MFPFILNELGSLIGTNLVISVNFDHNKHGLGLMNRRNGLTQVLKLNTNIIEVQMELCKGYVKHWY